MSEKLSTIFGDNYVKATVTFVGVAPIEIVRFIQPETITFCTLGAQRNLMDDHSDKHLMSNNFHSEQADSNLLQSLPEFDDHTATMAINSDSLVPVNRSRELYCTFTYKKLEKERENFGGFHRTLAMLAASPVVEGLEFKTGSIINFGEPLWNHTVFTVFLVGESRLEDNSLELVPLIPITETEAAFIRVQGAKQLYAAWKESHIDYTNPHRVLINP